MCQNTDTLHRYLLHTMLFQHLHYYGKNCPLPDNPHIDKPRYLLIFQMD